MCLVCNDVIMTTKWLCQFWGKWPWAFMEIIVRKE